MANQVVQVPQSLLVHHSLSATAKLVWMVAQLQPEAGVTQLSQRSGLSRTTIYAGLARLTAENWAPRAGQANEGATVPVPAELITNRLLEPSTRILYGLLLLTPGFSHPCGRFTYPQLATLACMTRNTVAAALDQLVRAEWVTVARDHRLAATHFELSFPGQSRGLAALDAAQERLSHAEHYGEALMREYLSLLIDSDQFEDDAEPGFLLRPRTGKLLQFDRYYPPNVAFELNGAQHYRATKRYTAAQSAEQRERDYIKMGICMDRAITLVIVRKPSAAAGPHRP
ncbi:MAG: hypothetical protein K0R39_4445 [Symbiobacteriaceae bacterium]|jgi:predicted transcriptional regulator|nr:hypothetical protein [Symbiobacteriaceae bacterium]